MAAQSGQPSPARTLLREQAFLMIAWSAQMAQQGVCRHHGRLHWGAPSGHCRYRATPRRGWSRAPAVFL